MALVLEDVNKVKQRTRWQSLKPGVAEALRALWKHMEALGNPDLQFKPISGLQTADAILGDVPCKLYALYGKKPKASTVDAWLKVSDSASAAGVSGDVAVKFVGTGGGDQEHCETFNDGLKMANGATAGSHTTNAAATKSAAADAITGFAIVGAP